MHYILIFVMLQTFVTFFGFCKVVENGKTGASAARHTGGGGEIFQIEHGCHYARAMVGSGKKQGVIQSVFISAGF